MSIPAPFKQVVEAIWDSLFYHQHLITIVEHSKLGGMTEREARRQLVFLQEEGAIETFSLRGLPLLGPIPRDLRGKEKLINEPSFIEMVLEDKEHFMHVIKLSSRQALEKYAKPSPESHAIPSVGPGIFYNPVTGIGFADGKEFTFKDHQPEFRVFAQLYERMNTSVLKEEVLRLIGKSDGPAATDTITRLVGKMRKRTGLDRTVLVQNNGNITLSGRKLVSVPKS